MLHAIHEHLLVGERTQILLLLSFFLSLCNILDTSFRAGEMHNIQRYTNENVHYIEMHLEMPISFISILEGLPITAQSLEIKGHV